jgi:tetratricopeptide (TPR) repeat protein
MAHCFYETADVAGGIDFLDDWLVGYHPDAPHYPHLSWHMALFELVQGRYQRSVEIYRQSIRPRVLLHENTIMGPPVADATSILWRHRLYGAAGESDYADDWREIEAFALDVAGGPLAAFNDAHCAFAFAATGNDRAMAALIDKLRAAAQAGDALAGEVALPLVLGIDAFGRGAYDETIRYIEPIAGDVARIAGSQAQRRIFEETLLRAYMLAGRYEHAERLLRKRLEHRHTGRDFYWLADTAAAGGKRDVATRSLDKARTLWPAADPDAPELLRARAVLAESAVSGSTG